MNKYIIVLFLLFTAASTQAGPGVIGGHGNSYQSSKNHSLTMSLNIVKADSKREALKLSSLKLKQFYEGKYQVLKKNTPDDCESLAYIPKTITISEKILVDKDTKLTHQYIGKFHYTQYCRGKRD